MKIFSLIIFGLLMFTGCTTKEPTVIYQVEKVYVPVKVPKPDITCSLDTEDDMFDCIVLQKKIIEEITE